MSEKNITQQALEDFGLDNVIDMEKQKPNAIVLIGFGVFLFALWAIDSYTSFLFFGTFGSVLGSMFGPDLQFLVAGLIGFIVVNVAYVAWMFFTVRIASSKEQVAAGILVGALLFLISLVSSIIFLSLEGDLSQNWINQETIRWLSIVGTIAITLGISINAVGLFLWTALSADWNHRRSITEIVASATDAWIDTKKHATGTMAKSTKDEAKKRVDDNKQGFGEQQSATWITNKKLDTKALPTMSQPDQPAHYPPQPSRHIRRPLAAPQPTKAEGSPEIIGFGMPEPQAKPEPQLYAVFRDGKQVTAPTTEADAQKQADQKRKAERDWVASRFKIGDGLLEEKQISVRPTSRQGNGD